MSTTSSVISPPDSSNKTHTHTPVGSIGDTGIYVNCDEFPEADLAKFAIVSTRSVGRREKKSNANEKRRKEKTSGRQTVEFARR